MTTHFSQKDPKKNTIQQKENKTQNIHLRRHWRKYEPARDGGIAGSDQCRQWSQILNTTTC